jgi:DNA polymerase epsilon subunit 3
VPKKPAQPAQPKQTNIIICLSKGRTKTKTLNTHHGTPHNGQHNTHSHFKMADTAAMVTEAPMPAGEPEQQQEQHDEVSAPAAAMEKAQGEDEERSQSQEAAVAASTTTTSTNNHNKSPEFEPPLSSVTKVIRRAVGDSVQVGKEAKATFTRAAGIFILYITACANDFSRDGKRATVTANDVYAALKELDFEDMIEPLQDFLQFKESVYPV